MSTLVTAYNCQHW